MATKQQAFIAFVGPVAVRLRLEGSPVFPSVRVAQALLETGATIHSWNNLVGFKAGRGKPNAFWDGRTISTKTWEVYNGTRVNNVTANWRVYDTIDDGFRDQDLLFHNSRYYHVRTASTPVEQTQALYRAGYATDPAYPTKLQNLISVYNLYQFDEEVIRVLNELNKKIDELTARVKELEAAPDLEVRVQALEGREDMQEVPSWAKAAVDKALKSKLITTGAGSFSFYRLLAIMDRKGLLDGK
ncbi:glycoside hydrolase family 73 protein [Paenibacillus swuensis]|nr:glucosaminidase domain-containing protein [Paenibacillus swuensis]